MNLSRGQTVPADMRPVDVGQAAITVVAALFFGVCTWASYARWANFAYRTFDLAYYVQAVWQLMHGRLQVSVENVPLLGNHVEPIVFLFAPLFALFRHPMLFVVVQNAALATMAPVGYALARRFGFDGMRASLLSAALVVTPAAGYIALHEFHPEALTAPLLLLMLSARLTQSIGRYWLWFLAVLACKENMALLLAAYCLVQLILERRRGLAELRRWYLWPLSVALVWFLFCSCVITPALNSGNIDYLSLYDRLGASAGDILRNALTRPQLIAGALLHALAHGNLLWALLLPFLGLPLLRPRWILIAAPIIFQHLLSWRSSEWTIYFHYAAPLLPLFWIAAVEAIALSPIWRTVPLFVRQGIPCLILVGCLAGQAWLGPAVTIASEATNWFSGRPERARKNAFIEMISPEASVVAPLPYLSHLAMREKLYSLHYILKGLKTLSHATYQPPPPTDFVLIDYNDSATFDASAGYYHPAMQTKDGRIIPSSDRLLHDFLKSCSWITDSRDEITLLKQGQRSMGKPLPSSETVFEIGAHTRLIKIRTSGDVLSGRQPLEVQLDWSFQGERDIFPWMWLKFTRDGESAAAALTKGLCAPEAAGGIYTETWRMTTPQDLAAGTYSIEAIFIDKSKRAWFDATGGGGSEATSLAPPIRLGRVKVER